MSLKYEPSFPRQAEKKGWFSESKDEVKKDWYRP